MGRAPCGLRFVDRAPHGLSCVDRAPHGFSIVNQSPRGSSFADYSPCGLSFLDYSLRGLLQARGFASGRVGVAHAELDCPIWAYRHHGFAGREKIGEKSGGMGHLASDGSVLAARRAFDVMGRCACAARQSACGATAGAGDGKAWVRPLAGGTGGGQRSCRCAPAFVGPRFGLKSRLFGVTAVAACNARASVHRLRASWCPPTTKTRRTPPSCPST